MALLYVRQRDIIQIKHQTTTTTTESAPTQSAEATTETAEATVLNTDVVVIGAGGGGLSAAIEAHDAGANVIIVEKMPFVGGNTARATGGINAAGSVFQKEAGINASKFAMTDGTFIGASATTKTEASTRPNISKDAKAAFKDGVYTGEATGNNGKIAVEVTVKDGFIDAIEVTEHHETSTIFASIQKNVIPDIIYSQTTEGVDAVTGASNSSAAMFEAVDLALEKAK